MTAVADSSRPSRTVSRLSFLAPIRGTRCCRTLFSYPAWVCGRTWAPLETATAVPRERQFFRPIPGESALRFRVPKSEPGSS
jgi:hypothetical protein